MSQSHSPLSETPATSSAPLELPTDPDRKRAYAFCASSFGVVRLEDIHEIANLKADLIACYRPVNSQEMFALERMAIAQQLILRAARLDAGLFTAAMNDVINSDNNPIVTMDPDMIGADIEITRQQNRNFCLAEGFRRIAKESDLMNLALRYRIQAERDYRRALEEFQRLERLRPKLPNEPNLLTEPDGKGDIAKPWELCPWIPKPPQETTPAAAEPASPAAQVEPVAANPPSGNLPVAASHRSLNSSASRNAATNRKTERVQSRRGRRSAPDRSAPERSAPKSLTQRPPFSSPNPRPLPSALGHNQLKPPRSSQFFFSEA